MFVVPSKAIPLMVRGVSRAVALAAKLARFACCACCAITEFLLSMYSLIAFTDGYFTEEAESAMMFVDLFATDSLTSKMAKVAVDTGLSISAVLSTLPKPKFVRAAMAFVAPVPPEAIGKTPANFTAVSANKV